MTESLRSRMYRFDIFCYTSKQRFLIVKKVKGLKTDPDCQ